MEQSNGSGSKDYAYLFAFIALSAGLNIYELIASPPQQINFAANILPIIAIAVIIFAIFKLAEQITGSTKAGLFSAALMAPIQVYTWRAAEPLTNTLGVLFFIVSLYFFMRIKDIDWRLILIVPVIFAFIHAYSLFLIPIYIIYVGIIKLKRKEVSQNELKLILTSTACILGIFLLFKITPAAIFLFGHYTNYFAISSAPRVYKSLLVFAGSLPIYIGLYGAYAGITKDKKSAILLTSAAITIFIGFITQLVDLQLGLPYFVAIFVGLAGFAFAEIEKFLQDSKLKSKSELIFLAAIIVVIALGVLHRVVFTLA